MSSNDFLKELGFRARNPEFIKGVNNFARAQAYAAGMLEAGKLSPAEFADLKAGLVAEYMNNLPMEKYVEARKSGEWDDLSALAGYNGSRERRDVLDARQEVARRVMGNMLDEAWEHGAIDDKQYAERSAALGMSEEMRRRVVDGDHANVAVERFVSNAYADMDPEEAASKMSMKEFVAWRQQKREPESEADLERAEMDDYVASRREDAASKDAASSETSSAGSSEAA